MRSLSLFLAAALASAAHAQCMGLDTLGPGINDTVNALTVWDPDASGPLPPRLVAGGDFNGAGSHDYIAWWDGTNWNDFGWGFDAPVHSLTTWSPDGTSLAQVIAGGAFIYAGADSTGPVQVNNIARWDGSEWRALGTGLSGDVRALISWDPDGPGPLPPRLVAGGDFPWPASIGNIGWWDGAAWHTFGWGLDGPVRALAIWDPDGPGPLPALLVAGGDFVHAGADSTGQVTVNGVAAWNGTAWSALGSGPGSGTVTSLVSFVPDGGTGQRLAALSGKQLLIWDGQSWHLYLGDLTTTVTAIGLWDPDSQGPLGTQLVATSRQQGCSRSCFDESTMQTYCCGTYLDFGFQRLDASGWHALPTPTAVTVLANTDGAHTQLVGAAFGGVATMSPSTPASFISQPQPAIVQAGRNAVFTFTTNQPIQAAAWYRGAGASLLQDGPTSSGSLISGAATSTLTISNVSAADAGLYSVTFRSSCGWVSSNYLFGLTIQRCGSADFNHDGDIATDADIEAFFACIAGNCCPTCGSADFNGDGDIATDADIEAFFRVLAGGSC
jgi:hypothetical protein